MMPDIRVGSWLSLVENVVALDHVMRLSDAACEELFCI
jgi:hypothetical protein